MTDLVALSIINGYDFCKLVLHCSYFKNCNPLLSRYTS